MEPEDRPLEAAQGGLQVEDRSAQEPARPRGLAEEFRAAGFPGETATLPFDRLEARAVTWTGSMDTLNVRQAQGGPLGIDQRYAWPVFPRVAVQAGETAVTVLSQTARSLPSAASVVRAIDAVTPKPEVASTLAAITTGLKQVAAIQTLIPNVLLEQPAFNSTIENDLRLALNEGLDKLVLDAVAGSGFQAPGSDPLLVSIRKAMTTIYANGYNPNLLDAIIALCMALEALENQPEPVQVIGWL
jgi:hypothetical protein